MDKNQCPNCFKFKVNSLGLTLALAGVLIAPVMLILLLMPWVNIGAAALWAAIFVTAFLLRKVRRCSSCHWTEVAK